ncbi:MAG: GAF and ANTAR domain-containing protein [Deltaproteobacteria bacterium]|nr:GAF and ANTAR domain-containing protein [Deltaproteobacteria bacterium]MBW1921319.1 GAF and ANTAR domain-containing protein [Deltaproteobacteria bacterium]MBW1935052.1 GAF and ANTAR domain-containing protein [Deltaproteobacteria bacterium]MBW1977748.1 GAF and ANTAR domain-containing protein [Deltaproteobacteria bacterium]MBW2043953.1 GAF and ANTAR domain-containing protein [Deltaproteobacteria bacterium]
MEKVSHETYDRYIRGLMDISQAITSDLYLEDILKLIVMVTAKVTGVEICSLWLIDEDVAPKKIRLKATQAIDPGYLKDRSLNMDEGVVGYVATHNQPLIVGDVLKEPRFKEKEMARRLGLVSMVSVPMHIKDDKVIGVLNCFTAKPHKFSRTEVNLITTVANQAAVAIFNTELMVKTKVIQEELETRKLVERAKEVLMRRRNMTGEQAYRWMQKRSMDSRKSMRRIAEAILLSDEI